MDQDQLSFFLSKYRTLDGDDLNDLFNRRASLVTEAILALDTVLAEKGINKDLLERYSKPPSVEELPSEFELARKLWKGRLAVACKVFFMITAWSPVQLGLNRAGVRLGTLSEYLLFGLLCYVGYQIGNGMTKEICFADGTPYSTKKRNLWFLLCGIIALYFVFYSVALSVRK